MTRFTTTTIAALSLSVVICIPALAERPSINMLNAEVNQLQAEVSAQQEVIDQLLGARLRVADGAGSDLGLLIEWSTSTYPIEPYAVTFIEAVGATLQIVRRTGNVSPGLEVKFADSACSTQPYVPSIQASVLTVVDQQTRYFVSEAGAPLEYVEIGSVLRDSGCVYQSGASDMIPAVEVSDTISLDFPLALPISIVQPN